MAKKKPKRRVIVPTWIVRDAHSRYRAFVAAQPPDEDWEGGWIRVTDSDPAGRGLRLCTADYEASNPKYLWLKPGGGPLKVRLVRA